MKPLDSYKTKHKLFLLGKYCWTLLVTFSVMAIVLFILLTSFLFWMTTNNLLLSDGIDFSNKIYQMFLFVFISLFIISIELISKLRITNKKSKEEIIKEEIEKKNEEELNDNTTN